MAGPTLLLVNKFYHDVGPAGGVGRYVLQEEQDLRAAGWRVVPFAMADEHARPSEWSGRFVTARDYSRPRWGRRAAADALSLLWNREAARNLRALLAEARPDVAHLHNIYHHLSPSILPELARAGVPAVMTLHDLRLLCPAIHMLRDGRVCERCRGGRFHEAVLGRCVKGSRAASLLAAVETAHQHHRRLYQRLVRLFICPSRFYQRKYAEWGYPPERLVHLPNFVDTEFWRPLPEPVEDAYLYFGRLSGEKGLRVLLEAQALWEREAEGEPAPRLRIAGSGPAAAETAAAVRALGLRRVELLGPLTPERLRREIARARFTVLPSRCYENCPMSVLESYACGRPVVGSSIGGIGELIEDGRDGILVPPGDPAALLAGLRRAMALGPEAGRRARARAETSWSRPGHMARLQEILRGEIAAAPPRRPTP